MNTALNGWGRARGQYRGSRHMPADANSSAWVITEFLCDERDLWKQNEVAALYREVEEFIASIDRRERQQ
ncbi:hypothetical protein CO670_15490 [Rhizobium sp. J15]|nr:hypothetical protein CO670_15490 [Rhizobium sp. J15]